MEMTHSNSEINYNNHQTTFFFYLSLIITTVLFSGFIANWFMHPERLQGVTLWIGLHGAFSTAWFLLLINQFRLARTARLSQHKFLGKLSIIVVIAIVITGVIMTLDLYDRLVQFGVFNPSDADARIRAGGLIGGTFLQWAIFVILYIIGLFNIPTPNHHKRLMLAASIQLMPEGLNRIVHIIGAPGYSMLLIIGIIYSSIIVYDLKTERSVQWSTLISVALFGVLATAIYTVFKTQTWGDWVVSMVTNI
jgi:hypothetical protein